MKTKYITIYLLLTFLCLFGSDVLGASKKESDMFLRLDVSRSKVYEGEKITYLLTLYSPTTDVVGVEIQRAPVFPGFNVTPLRVDSRWKRVSEGGKEYYVANIEEGLLYAEKSGTYKIGEGEYRIAIRKTAGNSGFWPFQRTETIWTSLSEPKVKIKVSSLPHEAVGLPIGDYDIKTWLPEGKIIKGQEAIAIVSIVGDGDLQEAEMKNLRNAFSGELSLKSVSERKDRFIRKGGEGSALEFECTFVPRKSGKQFIGPVEFTFFNTTTGKKQTVKSKPLEFIVHESEIIAPPPVYMGI